MNLSVPFASNVTTNKSDETERAPIAVIGHHNNAGTLRILMRSSAIQSTDSDRDHAQMMPVATLLAEPTGTRVS